MAIEPCKEWEGPGGTCKRCNFLASAHPGAPTPESRGCGGFCSPRPVESGQSFDLCGYCALPRSMHDAPHRVKVDCVDCIRFGEFLSSGQNARLEMTGRAESGRECSISILLRREDFLDTWRTLGKMLGVYPIHQRIVCEGCGELHIDEGEFATKWHHTHACQHCGMAWRPAVEATVGVRFLPGFKNESESG